MTDISDPANIEFIDGRGRVLFVVPGGDEHHPLSVTWRRFADGKVCISLVDKFGVGPDGGPVIRNRYHTFEAPGFMRLWWRGFVSWA